MQWLHTALWISGRISSMLINYQTTMDAQLRSSLLKYIKESFVTRAKKKLRDGCSLDNFIVHPFQLIMNAGGFLGATSSENLAKSLLLPHLMGTSLTTNFGDKMQKMCIAHLGAKASGINGMDIEFKDKLTGKETVAQLKAGPNTINAGDVNPIITDMISARRLLRQNRTNEMPVFAMCITYGTEPDLSGHYLLIKRTDIGDQDGVPTYVGKDFWRRLTGEENFYGELVELFNEAFHSENFEENVLSSTNHLALEIEQRYFTDGKLDTSKL